jgi:hypothetical protein
MAEPDFDRPFTEAAGLPPAMTHRDIEKMLDGTGDALLERLPVDFSRPLDAGEWENLNNKAKSLIGWIGAAASDRPWVVGAHESLDALPDRVRRRLLSGLGSRFLVIVSDDVQAAAQHDATVVAVADEGRILGCGAPEWFAPHADTAAKLMAEARGADDGGGPDDIEDDEELM